ncbi:MAG: hypothetical protein IJ087_04035 [Eggerthellaceae bacterium]|nr:hypothetical protein [Eggerthellaceae bacterium]
MTPWTTKQDSILRELGHLGAAAVAAAILRECGVRRSVRSVECRASRIHASLRVQQVCPECGVVGWRLNRQSGLCTNWTEILRLNEARAFNEILEAEREAASDAGAIEALKRENAMVRKRNSRTCKKYGLPTMRERQRGGGDDGGAA